MRAGSILVCIILIFSCARKYSITGTFSNGVPADMQQWVLDSSYHLYIREVFLDTTDPGDKAVMPGIARYAAGSKLIEIEYLLFSEQQNRAVYISTIPDKYQVYYAKKIKYLPREYLNAYDFSTFHFGKKTTGRNEIVFNNTATHHSDTWKYEIANDTVLHVYEVVERLNDDATNVYLVDEALNREASFIRTDSFQIVFRDMVKEYREENKKRGRPPFKRFSTDRTIYYRKEGNKNKYTVYFRFDKTLPPRYKDSTISFGNSRLVNDPF